MPKEQTLRIVENEINSGDLGKARDRLHGLISAYPDDLTLRSKLGDVYWKLHHPAMAGCYWYLDQDTSDSKSIAILAFESRFGKDPVMLWKHLAFKGQLDRIPPTQQARLKELASRYEARTKHNPLTMGPTPKYDPRPGKVEIGCYFGLVLIGTLALLGLSTVVRWISNWR